jgi:hypothetical protein
MTVGVLWGVIAVLLAFVVIISIGDLVRRHLGRGRTAAWVLILILLPFLGALLYWVLRQAPQEELERGAEAEREIVRGTPPPPNTRLGS